MELRANIPSGPIEQKWDNHRFEMKLVNPANKRRFQIIVVGSGLAGAAAAASLAELGYNVKCFCFQDSPRRAHSIAAQGGINAAKNYRNDGDSIYRLFYDTVKGGDYRSREANVYRLAEISVQHYRPVCGARAYRLRGNTADSSTRARLAARRCRARFTAAARQVNSCCWERIRPWSARSALGQVQMYPAHGNARPGAWSTAWRAAL